MKTRLFLSFLTSSVITISAWAQGWTSTGALQATGDQYLIAASHVGKNVYVVGNQQTFALSTDKGTTWSIPAITAPSGAFAGLYGTNDRVYASIKINTYDFELHYSLDNGSTWIIDTAGLPANLTATGKSAVTVYPMSNNYVIAANSTEARYKKLGDPTWLTTNIDFAIMDITHLNGKWFAIGISKILSSTDNGTTWTPITTSGLPVGFQGSKITNNYSNTLYMSNAPAAGGEDIYYSTDEGASWTLTNSAGHYTHANPWVGALYAVGDYAFAAVSPEFANIQDAAPFLVSSTASPSFGVGDTSGLGIGLTTTSYPFFFHIEDQLYTMMGDLFSSKPGFPSGISVSENTIKASIYPNPCKDELTLNTEIGAHWKLYAYNGQLLMNGTASRTNHKITMAKLEKGLYLLTIESQRGTHSLKIQKN